MFFKIDAFRNIHRETLVLELSQVAASDFL